MKVVIEKSIELLCLDEKTSKVLRLMGEGFKTESIKMSQFIKILNIMEFDDWSKFDDVLDEIVTPSDKETPKINESTESTSKDKTSENKTNKNRERISEYIKKNNPYTITQMSKDLGLAPSTIGHHLDSLDPDRKYIAPNNRSGSKPKKYGKSTKRTKTRTTLNHEQIVTLMKEYINTHDSYTIRSMAKELDLGYSTIARHLDMVDPNREKLTVVRKTKHDSIFNYITLSEDDLQRKSWLDNAINTYSTENKISKANVMNPVYKKLTDVYGVVFLQKSMDFLYEHKFTPVEDYPDISKYELLVLDKNLFDMAKSIMMDKYEQV